MSTLKRNLILSNKQQKSSEMALLTLEKLSGGSVGVLRAYNIADTTNLYLGVTCNKEKVYLDKVSFTGDACKVQFSKPLDLSQNFAAVLFKKQNTHWSPVLWDTAGERVKNQMAESLNQKDYVPLQTKNVNSHSPLDLDAMFELEEGEKLEELVESSFNAEKLNTQAQPFKNETETLKKNLQETQVFYDLVSDQIQDLFEKYPQEEKLESLIPNSKWVKVNYDDSTTPCVLGLIYDDITLKYICYGVPGEFSQNPPDMLSQYSQWLPLNPSNLSEGGYWVMYQDALTGDNVQIEFV